MTDRMKWLGLGGLIMLWIALVYAFLIDVPPPEEVPLKYQSGKAVTRSAAANSVEEWEVHSLRAQTRQLPETPKRNIFTAGSITRPSDPQAIVTQQKKQERLKAALATPATTPSPPSPTPEELALQQEALAAQAAHQQEELRRQQLQEQMRQYRYLGYVNQNGVQKAFLGKGREIYIIREGDTLDGKFMVALIDPTTVRITDSTSKLEVALKLKKEEGGNAGI